MTLKPDCFKVKDIIYVSKVEKNDYVHTAVLSMKFSRSSEFT